MRTEAGLVRRALSGHASIGLLAGAILYLLCLTGMVSVIAERWQRWEEPAVAELTAVSPAGVQAAIEAAVARDGRPTTHVYVRMPTDDLPRAVVTTDHAAHYIDGDGRLLQPEGNGFSQFLIHLHNYLHLPMTLGLIVVGAFGVMLIALALTGVLAHPRLFRDAFRLRARGQPQLARADWHNRLGTWTLPFALALAFTGSMLGLGQIGFQLIANERHGGNIFDAYESLYGEHLPDDPRPAPWPRADRAIEWMAANEPRHAVAYVTVEHPGERGSGVAIMADHKRRLIFGETYIFGIDGAFLRRTGLSDGHVGQQVAASAYKLHFGDFGGLAVELAYMVMGLGLCVVTASGMSIWLLKRRRKGLGSARFEAFWSACVWGMPILLVATAWTRFSAGSDAPLVAVFWLGLGVLLVAALVRPAVARPATLRTVLAAMLVATGLGHLLAGGWPAPAAVVAIDLALLVAALPLLAVDGRLRLPGLADRSPAPLPAE